MSAAKLLKKHELVMSTVFKNGKLGSINIYVMLLTVFFLCSAGMDHMNNLPKTDGKWVIVIDPGHGGIDPGASGSFSKEKNINLAIALKTGEYLRKNMQNVTVIFTRDKDSTVNLIDRPKIATRNDADLFISIHTNWAPQKSVTGSETYIMGLAKDQQNLEVAMKENSVMLLEDEYSKKYQGFDPNSRESYIIFTLTQSEFQKQSTELASRIQTQFSERVNRKDRSVKQAGFWVLFNTSMPSVLIETGFISNPAEEKYLNSKQGQEYIASAIFRACREYINDIDSKSNISILDPVTLESGNTTGSPAPGTLFFMVQVATSSARTDVRPENFNGIKDILEIDAAGRYKYATGMFKDYEDAVRYRKEIESIYPDAFVIAVKDNKILPLQQALEQSRKK